MAKKYENYLFIFFLISFIKSTVFPYIVQPHVVLKKNASINLIQVKAKTVLYSF